MSNQMPRLASLWQRWPPVTLTPSFLPLNLVASLTWEMEERVKAALEDQPGPSFRHRTLSVPMTSSRRCSQLCRRKPPARLLRPSSAIATRPGPRPGPLSYEPQTATQRIPTHRSRAPTYLVLDTTSWALDPGPSTEGGVQEVGPQVHWAVCYWEGCKPCSG